MQLSLTTIAALLSASAVHALPSNRTVPPPAVSDDLSETIGDIGSVGGEAIGGVLGGIPELIGGIIDAKNRKKAWRTEQERKKAEEEEKKQLEALADRRKVAEDKLSHAVDLEAEAEVEVKQAEADHAAAVKVVDELRQAVAEIDELAAKVGIPEDQLELINPDEHPEEPEESDGHKKKHGHSKKKHHHKDNCQYHYSPATLPRSLSFGTFQNVSLEGQ